MYKIPVVRDARDKVHFAGKICSLSTPRITQLAVKNRDATAEATKYILEVGATYSEGFSNVGLGGYLLKLSSSADIVIFI